MTGTMLKCHMLSPSLWAGFPMGSTETGFRRLGRVPWQEGAVRKPWERMDAQGVELELPRCASAAFLTRPGGGREGVFAFFG